MTISRLFIKTLLLLLSLLLMAAVLPVWPADKVKDQTTTAPHVHSETPAHQSTEMEVGVDEKLGSIIPPNLRFRDENDQPFILNEFVNKPTLILPIFYYCPRTCSTMLANLAGAIKDLKAQAGKEYRIIAFSFNDEETPSLARSAKTNYLKILSNDFPEEEWRFITGDKTNIMKLTNSMGFHFKKTGPHQFIHPNVLIVLSEDSKIIRYLYGPDFLTFDIGMALAEAEKGVPGVSIKKFLTYCFEYDSKGKKYVLRTFRILGTFVLIILAVFFFWVSRKKSN